MEKGKLVLKRSFSSVVFIESCLIDTLINTENDLWKVMLKKLVKTNGNKNLTYKIVLLKV